MPVFSMGSRLLFIVEFLQFSTKKEVGGFRNPVFPMLSKFLVEIMENSSRSITPYKVIFQAGISIYHFFTLPHSLDSTINPVFMLFVLILHTLDTQVRIRISSHRYHKRAIHSCMTRKPNRQNHREGYHLYRILDTAADRNRHTIRFRLLLGSIRCRI